MATAEGSLGAADLKLIQMNVSKSANNLTGPAGLHGQATGPAFI